MVSTRLEAVFTAFSSLKIANKRHLMPFSGIVNLKTASVVKVRSYLDELELLLGVGMFFDWAFGKMV